MVWAFGITLIISIIITLLWLFYRTTENGLFGDILGVMMFGFMGVVAWGLTIIFGLILLLERLF
jgi:hypothetical protein